MNTYEYNEYPGIRAHPLWFIQARAWESSHEDPPAEVPPCGVLWSATDPHPIDSNWFQLIPTDSNWFHYSMLFHTDPSFIFLSTWVLRDLDSEFDSPLLSLVEQFPLGTLFSTSTFKLFRVLSKLCHKLVVEGRNKHKHILKVAPRIVQWKNCPMARPHTHADMHTQTNLHTHTHKNLMGRIVISGKTSLWTSNPYRTHVTASSAKLATLK